MISFPGSWVATILHDRDHHSEGIFQQRERRGGNHSRFRTVGNVDRTQAAGDNAKNLAQPRNFGAIRRTNTSIGRHDLSVCFDVIIVSSPEAFTLSWLLVEASSSMPPKTLSATADTTNEESPPGSCSSAYPSEAAPLPWYPVTIPRQ